MMIDFVWDTISDVIDFFFGHKVKVFVVLIIVVLAYRRFYFLANEMLTN